MKNIIYTLLLSFVFCLVTPAIADDFSYLEDLTAVQKQKLGQYNHSYAQSVKSLDMRINNYQEKINQIKSAQNASAEQVNLLITSYERNIKVLNTQKEQLKKQLESQYKSVMSAEQYKQYLAQQMQVQNAFSDFLRK